VCDSEVKGEREGGGGVEESRESRGSRFVGDAPKGFGIRYFTIPSCENSQ
jgi:hypothetical protein